MIGGKYVLVKINIWTKIAYIDRKDLSLIHPGILHSGSSGMPLCAMVHNDDPHIGDLTLDAPSVLALALSQEGGMIGRDKLVGRLG